MPVMGQGWAFPEGATNMQWSGIAAAGIASSAMAATTATNFPVSDIAISPCTNRTLLETPASMTEITCQCDGNHKGDDNHGGLGDAFPWRHYFPWHH